MTNLLAFEEHMDFLLILDYFSEFFVFTG